MEFQLKQRVAGPGLPVFLWNVGQQGAREGRLGVSLGADYLVTDNLLIGGFFQNNQLSQEKATTGATAGGEG